MEATMFGLEIVILSTTMSEKATKLEWVKILSVTLQWTQNTKKTNGRCKCLHDRELPLPTWLVTRMQRVKMQRVKNYIGVGRKIQRHSLVDTEHQETNGRCKRFHNRKLPLPTWLVTRMQVLSTKSRKIESQLGWVERS